MRGGGPQAAGQIFTERAHLPRTRRAARAPTGVGRWQRGVPSEDRCALHQVQGQHGPPHLPQGEGGQRLSRKQQTPSLRGAGAASSTGLTFQIRGPLTEHLPMPQGPILAAPPGSRSRCLVSSRKTPKASQSEAGPGLKLPVRL